MGSKKLKAIAVRGHKKLEVADEDGLALLIRELAHEMKSSDRIQKFTRWGSAQYVGPVNEAHLLPTRNFRQGSFEGADKVSAERLLKDLVKHNTACFACPVASGKYSVVDEGEYAGAIVDGPEYETIWSFGPQCGIDRLDAIAAANMWCDRYGLDTITTGSVIGFAMECRQRGLLKDSDGLELRFGNHEILPELIRKIALREGIGDLLAEGTRAASKKIGRGSERFSMQVKGLELPAYDPRGAWGMALAYATACRGGCHLKAWTLSSEVFAPKYDRFSTEGKAKLVHDLQDVRAVVDSVGVCVFGTRAIDMDEMVKIVALTTGTNPSSKELLRMGDRIYTLERQLAVRDGISREDDTLPPRLFEEPLPELKESNLREEHLGRMLDEYYRLRGWDEEGRPEKKRLDELNLTSLLPELEAG